MPITVTSDKQYLLDQLNHCLVAIGDSHKSSTSRHHIKSFCIWLGHQGEVNFDTNYAEDNSYPWGDTLHYFSNYKSNVRGAIQAIIDSKDFAETSTDDYKPFIEDILLTKKEINNRE